MATVSLCMIVKDEEAVLGRCLDSVGMFADEIVVADTGSADGTVWIASCYTDKVYRFSWCDDFSAARNFAFSKGTGDYLFWLDADDVIPPAELKKLMRLKKRLDGERPDMVFMKYAVGFGKTGRPALTFYRERLIANRAGARWTGRVHEAIAPFGKVMREEITIEHRKVKKPDTGRNLRIFETMIKNGEPFGPRERYYYGKELCFCKRYREAAAVLEQAAADEEGWTGDRIDACRYAAFCRERISEERAALDDLLKGLRLGIPGSELCCDIGTWFYRRGRYEDAAFWYREALANGGRTGTDVFVQPEMHGYLPCLRLSDCYMRMGLREQAEHYRKLAARFFRNTYND